MTGQASHATWPGLVPTAVQERAVVVEQRNMARDTFCLRLRCPEIARQILPGQFVMVRLPNETDPLLGRLAALRHLRRTGRAVGIDFIPRCRQAHITLAAIETGRCGGNQGPLGTGFRPHATT
jgi:dihydroorotate dehydrogenase electron transfer subunit